MLFPFSVVVAKGPPTSTIFTTNKTKYLPTEVNEMLIDVSKKEDSISVVERNLKTFIQRV